MRGAYRRPGCVKHEKLSETDMVESEHRQIVRDSLFVLATLRIEGQADERRVRIRNLSAGGLMAEGTFQVLAGQAISVEIRNAGWVGGHVAWVQGSRFGIAFDQEIDARAVRKPPPSGEGVSTMRRPVMRFGAPDPQQLRKV
jgi:hypothetical protein